MAQAISRKLNPNTSRAVCGEADGQANTDERASGRVPGSLRHPDAGYPSVGFWRRYPGVRHLQTVQATRRFEVRDHSLRSRQTYVRARRSRTGEKRNDRCRRRQVRLPNSRLLVPAIEQQSSVAERRVCPRPSAWPIARSPSPRFHRSQSSALSTAEILVRRYFRLMAIAPHPSIKVCVALSD